MSHLNRAAFAAAAAFVLAAPGSALAAPSGSAGSPSGPAGPATTRASSVAISGPAGPAATSASSVAISGPAGPATTRASSVAISGPAGAAATSASSVAISGPAGSQAAPSKRDAVAKKTIRVQIGATTGVIYLNRTETKQVGQGGAWAVAGAIGVALAPQTAGLGTIAAIGVGVALGSIGSKVIDQQLAAGQCLKLSTPWLSLGTTVKVGWSPC